MIADRLLGILALSIFSAAVIAGETPPQKPEIATPPPFSRMYEITVTATASETETFRVPYNVNVITSKDISQRKNAPSLVDALDEIPGVMLQKTSPGQGSPFIRGFTGYQTLLLVDGVRINNSTFRSGPNQYWRTIDPLTIEQLEVVKGPFSVLHGSDAVGGTVNALTKSPEWDDGDLVWQGIDWGGRTYYRGASGERSNIGHVELEGAYKQKLAFLFAGSYKDFDDYTAGAGAGVQQGTGFSEFSGDAKIVYRPAKDHELTFLAQHFRQQAVPRTEQTVHSEPFHGTALGTEIRRDSDQFRSLAYAEYHGKEIIPIIDDVVVNLSYQNNQEERDRKRSDNRVDISGFDVDTFGIFAHLQTKTHFGTLSYGIDYYHDHVDSFKSDFNANGSPRSNSIQGPLADNASYDLAGAFVQNDVWLLDKRLNIVGGLRYSYAAADANQVDDTAGNEFSLSDNWSSVVGNARALYLFDKERHWNIFGGASQAFRAPSLSDLTAFDATSAVETPTPGLSPEEYMQFEAGFKADYEKFRFTASYFYTLIENQITQSPTGGLVGKDPEVIKTNEGKGWLQGVEVQAEYRLFKRWTLWSDFTWQEGEADQLDFASGAKVRVPLTRTMPTTAHLGLRYKPVKGNWWIEGVGTFVGQQDDLSLRDRVDTRRIPPGGTPGYSLLGIRGGVELTKDLTISGGVENITNKNYRVHGSGSNETGINAFLSLEWKF